MRGEASQPDPQPANASFDDRAGVGFTEWSLLNQSSGTDASVNIPTGVPLTNDL
jgi:hypothetical protein